MSASHRLPQRHLNLLPSPAPQNSSFAVRPSVADRFSQLLHEIEVFLLACTYEEMCKFWNAIANLRHYLQDSSKPYAVPQFLTARRRQRDFSRILEVLADLPYPKMHLSSHLATNTHLGGANPRGDRQTQWQSLGSQHRDFPYPHLATQR